MTTWRWGRSHQGQICAWRILCIGSEDEGGGVAFGFWVESVGGRDSAEMWRPVIRSSAHSPILSVGLIYGSVWHWLERGDGIDSGGLPWGHTTLAGSGWWDWFMGVCRGACNTGWIGAMGLIYGIRHGGTRLDRGDGIDLRGHTIGMWRCLGHVMGARLDQRDGIDLWGHAMGVRYWLDMNYEIDL